MSVTIDSIDRKLHLDPDLHSLSSSYTSHSLSPHSRPTILDLPPQRTVPVINQTPKEKIEPIKHKSPRNRPKKPKEKGSLETVSVIKSMNYTFPSNQDKDLPILTPVINQQEKKPEKIRKVLKSREGSNGGNEDFIIKKEKLQKDGSDTEKKDKGLIFREDGEKRMNSLDLDRRSSYDTERRMELERKLDRVREFEVMNLSPIHAQYDDEDLPSVPLLKKPPRIFSLVDDSESMSEGERITRQQQRTEKRFKLIQELVRSEETHVEALKTVIVNYLSPLKERKILSIPVIKKLFGNIELILTLNMDFLISLKARLDVSDCFGDLVVKMSVILRQLFTQYNENYQQAQLTYTECLKYNKDFEQFIQKNNQASPNSNLLTSLYLPIQRMIMYDSLLKDIIVLTSPNHEDYDRLCTAYKLLRSMDKAANRVVEKRKNLETVMKIQNSLIGDVCIALPHRRHVFEEDVMLVLGKNHKERTLYLFNDILLVAKLKKKNKYDVDVILQLDKITVDDLADDRHLFKITATFPESGPIDYLFYSAEHKPSWIQLLSSTIKKLHILPPEISDLRVEAEEHAEAHKEGLVDKEFLQNGEVPLTKKMLMKKIKKWSELKNPEELQFEIKKMVLRIEKYEEVKAKTGNDS